MREDVTQAMTYTFNATWVGGFAFAVPSVIVGLFVTAGAGMGAWGAASMIGVVVGAVLSAIVAFWKVTGKRMNTGQTMVATGSYILLLGIIGGAIIFGFPLVLEWVSTAFGIVGEYIVVICSSTLGFAVIVGLPSIVATLLAKHIYPRFATPLEIP